MRIAMVTNNFLPIISGVSTVVTDLYERLTDAGHVVYVIAPKYHGYVDAESVVIRVRSIQFNYRANYPIPLTTGKEIANILRTLNIDIVHSHHPFGLGQSALIACRRVLNIPIVFTYHTLYEEYAHYIPLFGESLIRSYVRTRVMRYTSNCDAVILPNALLLKKINKEGCYTKAAIIPSGIPLAINRVSIKKEDQDQLLRRYDISNSDFVVLCVTRIAQEKNVEFLIDVFQHVIAEEPKAKLLLVGDGHLKKKIQMIVKLRHLQNHVTLVGAVKYNQMPVFYSIASILAFVSKTDTQGMPLVESLPFGVPIVAVKSMASDEMVRKLNTGFVVPECSVTFAHTILTILRSKMITEHYRQNNPAKGKQIIDSQWIDKVISVYEGALK